MSYTLRALVREDEPFLWQMLYEAAHMAEEGDPGLQAVMDHPDISKYVRGWGRAGDMGFAAVDSCSSHPVGAAWLRLFTSGNKGYSYIDDATPELSIAVHPEHQGQGIGTALLTALIEAAQTSYTAVSLSVRADNPAVPLYRRAGFEDVKGSDIINRTGGTSFTMKIDFLLLRSQENESGYNVGT